MELLPQRNRAFEAGKSAKSKNLSQVDTAKVRTESEEWGQAVRRIHRLLPSGISTDLTPKQILIDDIDGDGWMKLFSSTAIRIRFWWLMEMICH